MNKVIVHFIINMNTVKQSKQASIRRKLTQSGIDKPHQFEQIISNLLNQRERLQKDLDLLKQKVAALQQKQSHKQMSRLRRPKQKINFREELQKKYEQLKQWQKRSLKAMKNTTFQIQYRTNLDKIMSVQQQIQTTMKQLNDEYAMNKRLMKGLKVFNKDQRVNNNVQNGIQQENYLLKKKLQELRKIVDKQATQEIFVHNHLIDIKEKERESRDLVTRHQRRSKDSRNIHRNSKVKTEEIQSEKEQIVSSVDSEEIIDLQINPSQIVSKDQIYQIQGTMNRIQKKWKNAVVQIEQKIKNVPNDALNQRREGSKLTFSKQFQLLIDRVKSKLIRLSEANKTKVKLLLQKKGESQTSKLSKRSGSTLLLRQGSAFKKQITQGYESNKQRTTPLKNNSKIKMIETKPKPIHQRQSCSMLTQTQFQEIRGLRRQYIGNIQALLADDRTLLKQYTNSSIKSLQIYYSDRGIATIKATYNLHTTQSTIQSKLALPDSYIQNNCRMYLIKADLDDFIRYFKVRYNKHENRITQIKIVTNKSIKNGWGDGKIKGEDYLQLDQQNQVDFVLDINQDEYPVSIYCSHIQKGPYWYLSGFGVQINDL